VLFFEAAIAMYLCILCHPKEYNKASSSAFDLNLILILMLMLTSFTTTHFITGTGLHLHAIVFVCASANIPLRIGLYVSDVSSAFKIYMSESFLSSVMSLSLVEMSRRKLARD
jgi:hypothetical protein